MKTFGLIAAAALAFAATPAFAGEGEATNAAFEGVRAGVTAGMDKVTGSVDLNNVVYGLDVGYDLAVTDRLVLGVEATVTNPLENTRTIGAAARAGVAVTDRFMPYVRAGWSNYQDFTGTNLDGLTVGGGLEFSVDSDIYVKAEYRYSDFAGGVGNHGVLVGAGVRF